MTIALEFLSPSASSDSSGRGQELGKVEKPARG